MWASDPMRALVLGLCACASTALAGPPLDADGFSAHVTGKTITYQQAGNLFGIEEYLDNRRVRWSVGENLCQYGIWYPKDQAICFEYEGDPVAHCWTFWLQDGALVALSVLGQPGDELYESARSDTPLACPGPDIGA
jgi:hypothetical protein